tara:strand:- start:43 stop:573 length:531 start_codon:yes stop_codon:yes gene_type:complete
MKYGDLLLDALKKSRSKWAEMLVNEIEGQLSRAGDERDVIPDDEYEALEDKGDNWSESDHYNCSFDDGYEMVLNWNEEDEAKFDRWLTIFGVKMGWNEPWKWEPVIWCIRDNKWARLDRLDEHVVANPDDPYISRQWLQFTYSPSGKTYITYEGERYDKGMPSIPAGKDFCDEVVE